MVDSNGPADLDALQTHLTQQFKLDLQAVERLRSEADTARSAETERKHVAQQQTLDQLLTLQVNDAQERAERRKFLMKFVLGPSGLIAVLGAAAFGLLREPPPPAPTVETVEAAGARASVHVEGIKSHIDRNEDKIHRTMEVILDQQVEWSDSTKFLSDKIDIAHPRVKKKTKLPESVRDGREKAKAIKKRRAKKKQKYDPADPFADLAKAEPPEENPQ